MLVCFGPYISRLCNLLGGAYYLSVRYPNLYNSLLRIIVSHLSSLLFSSTVGWTGGGMWAVFPVLFTYFSFWFWVHLVITALLSFNTLFNYWVAASVQAGPIPHIAYGNAEDVNQGDLDGHRFCYSCQKPKPPGAHHCRSCRSCVLDMDHHCPFVSEFQNCVFHFKAGIFFVLFFK